MIQYKTELANLVRFYRSQLFKIRCFLDLDFIMKINTMLYVPCFHRSQSIPKASWLWRAVVRSSNWSNPRPYEHHFQSLSYAGHHAIGGAAL